MKINKKGFIASSVLYCLAAAMAAIVFMTLANAKTIRSTNRETGTDVKEELNGTIYREYKTMEQVALVKYNEEKNIELQLPEFYVVEDSDMFTGKVKIISTGNYNSVGIMNTECMLFKNATAICNPTGTNGIEATMNRVKEEIKDSFDINSDTEISVRLLNEDEFNRIASYQDKRWGILQTNFWINGNGTYKYYTIDMERYINQSVELRNNDSSTDIAGVKPVIEISKKYVTKVIVQ